MPEMTPLEAAAKYKFTVNFYREIYHTGEVNYNTFSTAVVYAQTQDKAIKKIKSVVTEFHGIKSVTFEEVKEVADHA